MIDHAAVKRIYASSMLSMDKCKVKPIYYEIGDAKHLFAHRSIFALPSELYTDKTLVPDERFVLATMLGVFDAVRHAVGVALPITSGRRSQAKQEYLIAKGYKAAKTSPHVYGVALDIAVPSHLSDEDFADVFCEISETCVSSTPRVGYLSYRKKEGVSSNFIHVDYAPEIYVDGLPGSWKKEGIRW